MWEAHPSFTKSKGDGTRPLQLYHPLSTQSASRTTVPRKPDPTYSPPESLLRPKVRGTWLQTAFQVLQVLQFSSTVCADKLATMIS